MMVELSLIGWHAQRPVALHMVSAYVTDLKF